MTKTQFENTVKHNLHICAKHDIKMQMTTNGIYVNIEYNGHKGWHVNTVDNKVTTIHIPIQCVSVRNVHNNFDYECLILAKLI